jgi:hypothetical protein
VIVSHREKSRKIGDRWTEEVDSEKQQEIQTGESDANSNIKDAAVAEQIKDMSNTIQEMKAMNQEMRAMIQAMAKKH